MNTKESIQQYDTRLTDGVTAPTGDPQLRASGACCATDEAAAGGATPGLQRHQRLCLRVRSDLRTLAAVQRYVSAAPLTSARGNYQRQMDTPAASVGLAHGNVCSAELPCLPMFFLDSNRNIEFLCHSRHIQNGSQTVYGQSRPMYVGVGILWPKV